MAVTGNHYQALGVEPTASPEQISQGLDDLSRRADLLAYTSPQRSRELWERIRIMRHDLLDADRRARYDRALLRTGTPMPVLAAAVAPVARPDNTGSRATLFPVIPAALAGAITAAVATAAIVSSLQSPAPHGSPPLAMLAAGRLQHGEYVSGQPVTLGWGREAHADRYELEVFTAPMHGSAANRRLSKDITTRFSAYTLPVIGEQRYLWRVRAHVNGRWTAWSPLRAVTVAAPSLVRPSVIYPQDHAMLNGPSVRLCWAPVEGATSYHLRIRGIGGMTVHGTCTSVRVGPGLHRWTVAALAHGTQRYWSQYTSRHYFSVGAEVAALAPRSGSVHAGGPTSRHAGKTRNGHHASSTTRRVQHPGRTSHRSTHSSKATSRLASGTLVAAAMPRTVTRVVHIVRTVPVVRVVHRVVRAVSSGARRAVAASDHHAAQHVRVPTALPASHARPASHASTGTRPAAHTRPATHTHPVTHGLAPARTPVPAHVRTVAPVVPTARPVYATPAPAVASAPAASAPAPTAASGTVLVLHCVPGGACAVQQVPAQQPITGSPPVNYPTAPARTNPGTTGQPRNPVPPAAPPIVAPPPPVKKPVTAPPVSAPAPRPTNPVETPPTPVPAPTNSDRDDSQHGNSGNHGNSGDNDDNGGNGKHGNKGKHLGKK